MLKTEKLIFQFIIEKKKTKKSTKKIEYFTRIPSSVEQALIPQLLSSLISIHAGYDFPFQIRCKYPVV